MHWERSLICDFLYGCIIVCGCIGMLELYLRILNGYSLVPMQLAIFTFPSLSLHWIERTNWLILIYKAMITFLFISNVYHDAWWAQLHRPPTKFTLLVIWNFSVPCSPLNLRLSVASEGSNTLEIQLQEESLDLLVKGCYICKLDHLTANHVTKVLTNCTKPRETTLNMIFRAIWYSMLLR